MECQRLTYWKLETFRSYIAYETLATPSLYAYNKTRTGREILKNNLADFLFVWSSTLNSFVQVHVPNFIRDVMLTMTPWVTGDETSSTLRKVLCELFVRNHVDALKCVLSDANKLNRTLLQSITVFNTANLVAVTAATGCLKVLRLLADKDRQLLWVNSSAFGYPLDAAVYAGQFGVVKTIVQQAIIN